MARYRMLFGVGFPLIFVSITSASYDGIPPDRAGQASALINAARNTGGSIGISLISNVLWRREQFHQNMLVDQALPSSVQYQDTLHHMTNYFIGQGTSPAEAPMQTIAWVGQQVLTQASFLAYMDAFWVLTLLALAAVPLALMLRKVKLGAAARRRAIEEHPERAHRVAGRASISQRLNSSTRHSALQRSTHGTALQ
jgi:MFS transporter, DHA2 family, multidrug resistance protein